MFRFDRLATLERVRTAGISVCCGGIIGMGEGVGDRCGMLQVLANQAQHPESVPINSFALPLWSALTTRRRLAVC